MLFLVFFVPSSSTQHLILEFLMKATVKEHMISESEALLTKPRPRGT